jgi:hypothetical protein
LLLGGAAILVAAIVALIVMSAYWKPNGTVTGAPVVGTPPSDHVKTTPSTETSLSATAPTPSTVALLARLDETWQCGDWPAAIAVLDTLQSVDPSAADFTDKRYVAQYSWGKSLFDEGDKTGAATHFAQASQVDPSRAEAKMELLALTPTPTPRPTSCHAHTTTGHTRA